MSLYALSQVLNTEMTDMLAASKCHVNTNMKVNSLRCDKQSSYWMSTQSDYILLLAGTALWCWIHGLYGINKWLTGDPLELLVGGFC